MARSMDSCFIFSASRLEFLVDKKSVQRKIYDFTHCKNYRERSDFSYDNRVGTQRERSFTSCFCGFGYSCKPCKCKKYSYVLLLLGICAYEPALWFSLGYVFRCHKKIYKEKICSENCCTESVGSIQFAFFDMEESLFLFITDYLAVMGLLWQSDIM